MYRRFLCDSHGRCFRLFRFIVERLVVFFVFTSKTAGVPVLTKPSIESPAVDSKDFRSLDLMSAHLFKYSQNISSFDFSERGSVEGGFMDDIAFGSSDANR